MTTSNKFDEKYVKKFGLESVDELVKITEDAFLTLIAAYSDKATINAKVAKYNGISVDALIMSPHYFVLIKQYTKTVIRQESIDIFKAIGIEEADAIDIIDKVYKLRGLA